jgi:hypothetical protein
MARLKGSTTKAGSTRTQRPAQDVNARIEGPHSGKAPKRVGPETTIETKDLRGIPGEGSVKEAGPSELRSSGSVGSSGSVKSIGKETFEDRLAAQGGELRTPQSRQSGSVKQVGPLDRGYEKLTENAMPATQTQQARFSPKRGSKIDKGIPLLKSGVGRAHAWSVYAGQPGTQRLGAGNGRRAYTSDSLLINGRRRQFGPEPFSGRRDLVSPDSVVLPGGTRIY